MFNIAIFGLYRTVAAVAKKGVLALFYPTRLLISAINNLGLTLLIDLNVLIGTRCTRDDRTTAARRLQSEFFKLHIHKIATDTASPHDSMHFEAAMDPLNTSRNVFADQGYPSKERKGYRNKPLTQT